MYTCLLFSLSGTQITSHKSSRELGTYMGLVWYMINYKLSTESEKNFRFHPVQLSLKASLNPYNLLKFSLICSWFSINSTNSAIMSLRWLIVTTKNLPKTVAWRHNWDPLEGPHKVQNCSENGVLVYRVSFYYHFIVSIHGI